MFMPPKIVDGKPVFSFEADEAEDLTFEKDFEEEEEPEEVDWKEEEEQAND